MPAMDPPENPTASAADQEAVLDVVRRLAAAASAAHREIAAAPNEAAAEQVREAMVEVSQQARRDLRAIDPAAIAALHASMDADTEAEPRSDG